jgi:hypothetical protein
MTAPDPVSAPLEANDPRRARALKAKIRDRVSDVRRHLLALRTAMAATAEQVHESALIVVGNFPSFYDAYRAWIKHGFAPQP